MRNWFNSKGYLQGIFWMLMVCLISCSNDALVKYLGVRLSGAEVAFFRFLFGTIILLPFMFAQGQKAFITQYPGAQCIRALLLVMAMVTWSYSIPKLPLTLATLISFTTPFFVLPLAKIFLNEQVGWSRWLAITIGFIGVLVSIHPTGTGFNPMALALIVSTLMFATLDVINKKLLTKDESLLSMIFYSGLGTALLGLIPAVLTWQTPTSREFFLLLLLGNGGTLILYCLLKAFTATEVSALQPFRYTEFVISGFFGLIIFQEWPTISTLFGALIIIISSCYIAIYQSLSQSQSS